MQQSLNTFVYIIEACMYLSGD